MPPPDAPLLLAVDTATRRLAVAVLRGESVLAESSAESERPHSETLLPAIDRVLGEARIGLGALGGFAVSVGPGSFTGLRVALSTLKAFAFGDARPVAAVPTLAALAATAGDAAGPLAALLDARRGEVYAAAWSGGPVAGEGAPRAIPPDLPALLLPADLAAESVWRPDALAARLPPDCALVAGEDALGAAQAIAARLGPRARVLPPPAGAASAAVVGRLGARLLAAGLGRDAALLVPRYLRRAEAEARRTGRPLEDGRFDSSRPLP
jgi:tRNA threonylcarbamoyladenosine biosynthesis protein TsaB